MRYRIDDIAFGTRTPVVFPSMDLGDGWIVVRDETRVMTALRPGTERRRASWSTGVERTHERAITFVAAPVGGWTIVLGDDPAKLARVTTWLRERAGR